MPYVPSTQKPRRKQQQQQNNKNIIPDVIKAKDIFITNPFGVDNEIINPAVESKNRLFKIINLQNLRLNGNYLSFSSAKGHTPPPTRIGLDKMRNTQMPAPIPTHRTSWINTSSAPCPSDCQSLWILAISSFIWRLL